MSINEGIVTYTISYPDIDENKLSPYYPKEIKLVFKGSLSSYLIRSGLGTVKIVRLLNFDTQNFTSLLINTWGTNMASTDTPEEIQSKENSANYQYTFQDSSIVVDGLTCKKALVKNIDNNSEFEIYYAPSITINNWNSPYVNLKSLLIKYPFSENGMNMLLEATRIEPREIDSSFFAIKGEFTWLTSTEFNTHLESLKK